MIVGVPREIKTDEYRVAMLPVGAEELTSAGHQVLIEAGAGQGSGIVDAQYASAGATMVEKLPEILGQGRHDRQGQGTSGLGVAEAPGRARSSSPTFTSPRTRPSPVPSSTAESRRLPTRHFATRAGACRC